jgi:hypothetical protein
LTVKELKSNDEILEAFPVMKQLRNQLNDSTYLQLVKEAQQKDCYHCDLVTDAAKRSNGYGKNLLTFVQVWKKKWV